MLDRVTVVIPMAPEEPEIHHLLGDLAGTPVHVVVSSEGSRAKSLNRGADRARGTFLWFLHADCRVTQKNMHAVKQTIKKHPRALSFFDLKFEGAGPVKLNEWFGNMRARWLGLPYGDQGFVVGRRIFEKLGGFPEENSPGEDLKWVWRARQSNIPLHPIGVPLETSARTYREQGWLRTTLAHHYHLCRISFQELFPIR